MKKKVGTILDSDLYFKAKKAAVAEKKSISILLGEALENYLVSAESGKTSKNIALSTHGAMKISADEVKDILAEDNFLDS